MAPHDLIPDHIHPHDHAHDHLHRHHNGGAVDHLHSHPHAHPHAPEPKRVSEDDQLVIDALIDGFVAADDKTSFLRLARIPFEIASATGGAALKLVDIELTHGYQVGTASPGFASRDLVYHPFPGNMVRERTELTFIYVSLAERRDVPLAEMIRRIGKTE